MCRKEGIVQTKYRHQAGHRMHRTETSSRFMVRMMAVQEVREETPAFPIAFEWPHELARTQEPGSLMNSSRARSRRSQGAPSPSTAGRYAADNQRLRFVRRNAAESSFMARPRWRPGEWLLSTPRRNTPLQREYTCIKGVKCRNIRRSASNEPQQKLRCSCPKKRHPSRR